MKKHKKIALTGGPNSGKTTALTVLKETFGPQVELVREAATMVFSGGFPRTDNSRAHIEAAQKIIFVATREMEALAEEYSHADLIVCDRGTVDAAVYWPAGVDDFFKTNRIAFRKNYFTKAVDFSLVPVSNDSDRFSFQRFKCF